MLDIGVYSYLASAGFFAVLSILLLTSWRGRLQGALLVTSALISVVWGASHAYEAYSQRVPYEWLFTVELARSAAWLFFVLGLLGGLASTVLPRLLVFLVYGVGVCLVSYGAAALLLGEELIPLGGGQLLTVGGLILALLGLVTIEQLYRNTPAEQRWSVKFLALGVGGLFAYDLYMYADALLFTHLDAELWNARGAVNALLAPAIALAVSRNPSWSLKIFVSRHVVFYTTSLVGAGLYLLAMALGGYYIRSYGGEWGGIAQIIFFVGAGLVLLVMLSSGQTRARLKVFLGKHFYHNKYDYREEWMRLIQTLSDSSSPRELRERVAQSLADVVESTASMLWLADEQKRYRCVATNYFTELDVLEANDSSFVRFLDEKDWIIDLEEYARDPGAYGSLELPSWLTELKRAWLVVPLRLHEGLLGFVVLAQPRAPRAINWEDRDLLKAAGRQAASYLALVAASEALGQAQQFEAFNRLSAYVVHDLKNVTAQLGLVVSNAAKHKHNPEFMEDAINTVSNATEKMNRMLAQLRKGRFESHSANVTSLNKVLSDVVSRRAHTQPQPTLVSTEERLDVMVESDRLGAVLEHLVQNAQEATAPEGKVELRLGRQQELAVIEIEDSGCGMDTQFIRERLFKPFDTTKGNAGMGVGAYEAREFVLAVGGDIQVSSEPGVGTRFTVTLPLAGTADVTPVTVDVKEAVH